MKPDSQVLQGVQGDQVGQWGRVLLGGLEGPGKNPLLGLRGSLRYHLGHGTHCQGGTPVMCNTEVSKGTLLTYCLGTET